MTSYSMNTANILARFLEARDLRPYSMVYTGKEKLSFLREGDLIIDDAPDTISRAFALGAEVHYLAWPWNDRLVGHRWSDLYQMLGALDRG